MCTENSILSTKSPFKHHEKIIKELSEDLEKIRMLGEPLSPNIVQQKLDELTHWLCETPSIITYRINTSVTNSKKIWDTLREQSDNPLDMQIIQALDLIIVNKWNEEIDLDLEIRDNKVTVDASCGAAVLRGAHVFAPGIMSMPHGLQVGDIVSVFADSSNKCKKGAKSFDDKNQIFVGNGIVKKIRRDLFDEGANPSGVGIQMISAMSRLPQLGESSITRGHAVLQNLPSILTSKILDPQPGDVILDMCSAPGNKLTHLSALMKGEGTLIALEKISSKMQRLRNNCEAFSCKNVRTYNFDATKAVLDSEFRADPDEPPFTRESFNRILLDGPCSGLGQRPQFANKMTPKELRSYVPLQRKLFTTAVKLLKVDGVLVYSTCTVTIAENEGIVAWALKNYPELKLSPILDIPKSLGLENKYCGSSGYVIDGLSEAESEKLLRFGPQCDTVGFFIARFVKTES